MFGYSTELLSREKGDAEVQTSYPMSRSAIALKVKSVSTYDDLIRVKVWFGRVCLATFLNSV